MNKIIRKKNENYTIVSNVCVRDNRLSLKAKGLMSLVMSLPDDWDFSIQGLSSIVKEGKSAIYAAINELKEFGYCNVITSRDDKGKIIGNDYTFFEEPCADIPYTENPYTENQDMDNPNMDNPNMDNQDLENQPQINKDIKEIKTEIIEEKEDTNVSPKKKDEWRDNYDVYVSLVDDALGKLFVDEDYKNQMEQLYTNIDYKRTLIACSLYWKQEEQWKKYKRKNTKKPNFVSAIKNGFHINKVHKSKYASEIKEYGYPKSVEDVTIDDTQSTLIQFQYWMEGKMIKVWDGFDKGFPTTDAQYKLLLDHTIGGAKGFSYVVLVFNRDGWDKYKDERGFMFTYSNYIKANGLYKE